MFYQDFNADKGFSPGGGTGNIKPEPGNKKPNLQEQEKNAVNKTPEDNSNGAGLADKEKGGLYSGPEAASKLAAAGGAQGKAASQIINKIWGNKKRKRNTLLVGGSTGLATALLVMALTLVASNALVTIEKTVYREAEKIVKNEADKAGKQIASKLICRALPLDSPACGSSSTNPADEKPTSAAQDEAAAQQEGEGLRMDMDKFSFTDPAVEQNLSSQGFKVNVDPTTGEFKGLTDTTTGQDVTGAEIEANPDLLARWNTAMPEFKAGLLDTYRADMVSDAGVSFEGLPETKDSTQTDQAIESEVDNGATSTDITQAASGVEDGTVTETPPSSTSGSGSLSTDYQSSPTDIKAGGRIGNALKAAQDTLKGGGSGSEAIKAGVDAFGSIDPLFIATVLDVACGIYNTITSTALSQSLVMAQLLIRHGNALGTWADQLKSGTMGATTLNTIMGNLDGTSGSSQSAPFSASAAWQRDTGNPVTNTTNPNAPNYTPDILPSAQPSPNGAAQLIAQLDNLPILKAFNFGCHLLTGFIGTVVQAVAGVIQMSSEAVECGTGVGCVAAAAEQASIIAANLSAVSIIQKDVIPSIISYFIPATISGTEGGAQWLNNTDAGLNLSMNDYARHLGSGPISSATATSISAKVDTAQVAFNNSQPLTYRLFSFNDTQSLVSRLAVSMPIGMNATLTKVSSYITSFPSVLLHTVSSLILARAFAATTQTAQPWLSYNTQEYGLTSQQSTQYDPLQNEQYLFSNVNYQGHSVKRIDALGNPDGSDGRPIPPNSDNNPNDLLHCFNLGYYTLITDQTYQTNCGVRQNGEYYGIGQIATIPNSTPPTNDGLPNDSVIAQMYCNTMGVGNDPGCKQYLISSGQVNNDLGHFEQYILDTNVMANYLSLTQVN